MYTLTRYNLYEYSNLSQIKTIKRRCKDHTEIYNNMIIMLDTETSKKDPDQIYQNHICAFTISIRAHGDNICTLYGNKPSECIDCINRILKASSGDHTIIYVHNLAYDYVFLRQFMFEAWGHPEKALNTKPHYPILIQFANGLILKDSLILSQKSLDKWAKDLNVEHQKAVGKWDYDQIRNQSHEFTADELEYIEHDTLAGVECIDILKEQLHHYIYSMPYTATGIVREEARKIGRQHYAHDFFKKTAPSFEVYKILEQCFHGGYTHANRYTINEVHKEMVKCYDFKSSYPYVMLTEKYPTRKFTPYKSCSIEDIIKVSDKYGFIMKLILYKPRIKSNDVVMPVLQVSKCTRSVNMIADNGRVLCAGYIEIYVTEVTLKLIMDQYDFDGHYCTDVYYSRKTYLPRWFTDYIFKLFRDKSELDGVDQLNYMLSKAKLNSCYGMAVQRPISNEIEEDYLTGEYNVADMCNAENYEQKYVENRNKFLAYQWGVWVTEYAMKNLHEVGAMCDQWIYSDTDSVFGINFDEDKLNAYNECCLEKLEANGYGSIEVNGKTFTLGVAELDKVCTEFITLGAKRYCYRSADDQELHITVAGVPKKGACCLKDDINNFHKGLIFNGEATGKKQHTYFFNDIYIDKEGNETGDSIDLSKCDYLLDDIEVYDWERIFAEEIEVQAYDS